MPRFTLRDILWLIAAIAILSAVITTAHQNRDPLTFWGAVESLGYSYGILIPASAYLAFVITWRIVRRTSTIRAAAGALPLATMPILIAAVAALHGYYEINMIFAYSPINAGYIDISRMHALCVFRLLTGILLALPAILLASASVARRSFRDTQA